MSRTSARAMFTRKHVFNVALIDAAKSGDSSLIAPLVKSGASVNTTDRGGYTSLTLATLRDHEECVRTLIREGADVNATDIIYKTALFWSANRGNVTCLEVLLEAGADVNKCDSFNRTALWTAGQCGHVECVKALISAGADVNITCRDGWSALMEASFEGHKKCVEILLTAGANLNCSRFNGESALTLATVTGQLEIIKCLLGSGAHINTMKIKNLQDVLKFHRVQGGPLYAELCSLLQAAGEKFSHKDDKSSKGKVPCLMPLCREAIRRFLIQLDPKLNLFIRIPRLGLPWLLTSYLLHNMSLDPM